MLGQTSFLQQHYLTLKSDAAIPYPQCFYLTQQFSFGFRLVQASFPFNFLAQLLEKGGEVLASLLLFGHVQADTDQFCWA